MSNADTDGENGAPRLLPIEPTPPRAPRRPTRSEDRSPDPEHSHRIPYEPALDGLRGMAVLAVVLYHLDRAGHDLPFAAGGFLGVDAFFVLSGFLITSLLLVEWMGTGTIDLRTFWSRRARRLLPALFLVLAFVVLYAAFFAQPIELQAIRGDGIASLFYVTNWRFIADQASYFDSFITESPLLHMWSLAIEEQWYLFWPLVVLGILRWRHSIKAMVRLTIGLAVLASAWMIIVYQFGLFGTTDSDPSRAYFGTDTRVQSLLVGAALAAALIRGIDVGEWAARWGVPAAGTLAGIGLIVAWMTIPDDAGWIYQGGLPLLAVAVAAVILAAVQPDGNPVRWFLSLEPLRRLGIISYGVYLWHWPIFVVLRPEVIEEHLGVRPTGLALLVLRLAATVGVAMLSYNLVERPIRAGWLRERISFSPVLIPASAVILLLLMVTSTRGALDPYELVATEAPEDRPIPTLEELEEGLDPETRPAPDAEAEAEVTRVLIIGDSVANTMAEGFTRQIQQDERVLVWNQTVLFCELSDGPRWENGEWVNEADTCEDWRGLWSGNVEEFHPDVAVLSFGAWEIFDREVDGQRLLYGTEEFDEYFLSLLGEAIDTLSSEGALVALTTVPRFERQDTLSASVWTQNEQWRTDHLNELLATAVEDHPDQAVLVDLGGFLCPSDGPCIQRLDDGSPVRYDGIHFSDEGAEAVAGWMAPQLAELAGR